MRAIRALIFIFIFLPLSAKAELAILNWDEFIQLTNGGKKSMINIKGQVKDLQQNQAMSAFSIGFSPAQNISIISVSVDGKEAKYDFAGNSLKIKFPDSKSNGQLVSVKIAYEEKYNEINKYLRQELVYVPKFAAGGFASIIINFSGYELTTYNLRAIHEGDRLTYTGIIPSEGIRDIVKFTPREGLWSLAVKTSINTEKDLGDFSLKAPDYFHADRQKVGKYSIDFSKSPVKTEKKGDQINYSFKVSGNKFEMKTSAQIFTGAANRKQIMRNMIAYSQISPSESRSVVPLLVRVRNDKKYAGMPLYVAIGEFVNEFIKYDKSYTGKLPELAEIVKNQAGVCTEFARLYDAMARLAGIPSLVVDGAACGEYEECQGHSWNMIFYNGAWIEVDPTWNLMSGIVSSSHVYINDGGKGEVEMKYYSNVGKLDMNMDLEMYDLTNGKKDSLN
jgi:transglutaminase-like putative cysteine protease